MFRYDDNGDPLIRPCERILMALRWHEWIEPIDLYESMHLEGASKDRANHVTALSRLIKSGRVEKRIAPHLSADRTSHLVSTVYVRLAPNVRKAVRRVAA
jgi:hypothetical protein